MSHHKEDSDSIERYRQQLRKLQPDTSCPSPEALGSYVNNECDAREVQELEEHFDLCPACLGAIKQLRGNRQRESEQVGSGRGWARQEKKMDVSVYAYLESLPHKSPIRESSRPANDLQKRVKSTIARLLAPPKLAFAGLVALLFVASLTTYVLLSRPPYFQLADIHYETSGPVRSQSGPPDDLTRGLQALELKDHDRAITLLRSYLKTDSSHYLANFELGLAYLFSAKQRLLGLPCGFDHEKVERGVHYLKMAQTGAHDNPYYQEDCLWYLAKAHLMLGTVAPAKQNLQELLTLAPPGSGRKQAAWELLLKLGK